MGARRADRHAEAMNTNTSTAAGFQTDDEPAGLDGPGTDDSATGHGTTGHGTNDHGTTDHGATDYSARRDDAARGDSGPAQRELQRPRHDRMVAGVCAGIAGYFDIDVTIVRIVVAALTVAGGAGLAIYLAGWLLIPEEGASQSIAGEFIGPAGR
jgi:phage shock protein C